MDLTLDQSALRDSIASANPNTPSEELLHRAKFALLRTRRLNVHPVQPYRVDPTLAAFMERKGLLTRKETEEELRKGGSGFRHILCELTPLGVAIRDTF